MEKLKSGHRENVVEKFRNKLSKNGQSLKWWHAEYAIKLCKYNYFIRQINSLDTLKANLLSLLEKHS